jgi:hypothetical protein
MSTTPPPPPGEERPADLPGYTITSGGTTVRLPIPGNAEFLLYLVIEVVFAIIWAASDRVDAGDFVGWTAILTGAYVLSRGIAKASRVLEQ